ncbi:hypothetical protein KSZ_28430 [Dictyobacter formicarum]|uniref:VOC domain-containing protein n=1 Tax=Dictyobacter formicarum TaxID=2778368 RepID=A0ABQ3VF91_9CHLR|nr:hypothetical protein KSZ_28430 [Dictyobacter formicarum]
MDYLHADLKAKGVVTTSEPEQQPWGIFMTIQDPDQNSLLLVDSLVRMSIRNCYGLSKAFCLPA